MNAKLTHTYFIGLVIIFLSFFFTFYKLAPKQIDYEEIQGIRVSASMWDAAMGSTPSIKFENQSEGRYGGFGFIGMSAMRLVTIPKFLGINFLIILILAVWALMNFLFNENMTDRNRQSLIGGIGISFILFFLILIWDINYYRSVINDTGLFKGRLRDLVALTPAFGFFLFLGGWMAAMYGAFFQRRGY
jgi:hypothetical protein